MARVMRSLVFGFLAILVISACAPGPGGGELADQVTGRWVWTGMFGGMGDDTVTVSESPATLVLLTDQRFREIRGDTLVVEGEYRLGSAAGDQSDIATIEFLTPSELFGVEREWEVDVRGDTLLIRTLESDGWSHWFLKLSGSG